MNRTVPPQRLPLNFLAHSSHGSLMASSGKRGNQPSNNDSIDDPKMNSKKGRVRPDTPTTVASHSFYELMRVTPKPHAYGYRFSF
jgi:hypothetical protein